MPDQNARRPISESFSRSATTWSRSWVYGAAESPNGELGYYVVSAGENVPWRVRTRPPCYINYQVFPKLMEGHMLSDVVAVLGSINIIAAELDR